MAVGLSHLFTVQMMYRISSQNAFQIPEENQRKVEYCGKVENCVNSLSIVYVTLYPVGGLLLVLLGCCHYLRSFLPLTYMNITICMYSKGNSRFAKMSQNLWNNGR